MDPDQKMCRISYVCAQDALCVQVITRRRGGGLAVVFGGFLQVIGGYAFCGFREDHLGYRHAGMEPHGADADVDYFESYLCGRMAEAGIDESGGDVHHHAKTGETRLSG